MLKPFKPRDRKQRKAKRRRTEQDGDENGDGTAPAAKVENKATTTDSNAEIVIPLSKAELAEKKKQQLLAEMRESVPKMSSKKQKRFNKYIDNKLRKEEKAELIQQLAATKVDTTLFRSSKSLGAVKESKKEKARRALLESRRGINEEENKELLYKERKVRSPSPAESSESESDSDEEEGEEKKVPAESESVPKSAQSQPPAQPVPPQIGSGLKRPLEVGSDGFPVLVKRQRVKSERRIFQPKFIPAPEEIPSSSEEEETDDAMSEDDEAASDDESASSDDSEAESAEEKDGSEESSSDEEKEEDPYSMDYETLLKKVVAIFDEKKPGTASGGDENSSEEEEGDEESEDSDSDEAGSEGEDEDEDGESEDGEDEDEEMEEVEAIPLRKKGTSERANAFKEWARQQKNIVVTGSTESAPMPEMPKMDMSKFTPRPRDESPHPEDLIVKDVDRKVYSVVVNRPEEIQTARLALPVVGDEQRIMEAVHANDCVVLCGETGSGKTTQVPQFLFEAGYGSPESDTPGIIGVTQPRRVAAVSMAKRVGTELGAMGDRVAYQIRFEATVSPKTAIKFMTDGVLLRELGEDFLLKKYSAIIVDEAHERSINTDILIGILSRILKLRKTMSKDDKTVKPLKLIIMSATLRVSDFVENPVLFKEPPPLIKTEARQHPVSIHFNRRTPHDYVEEAYKKICKIHRRLPPGGILVFLTGQNEISDLLRRLRTTFPPSKKQKVTASDKSSTVKINANEAVMEEEDVELGEIAPEEFDGEDEPMSDDDDDEEEDMGIEQEPTDTTDPLYVLPLYSLLPTTEQMKVFEPVPENHRLCVLSTNVAETSLTIPGIRYVVDCGRAKSRKFDKVTGVQSFEIGWVSKASANQRAGRAGRTGPGHCYRLYSSAVYERDFEKFSEAEILRMPIEGVVLQMKSMHIDTISNFPFPTAPDRDSLAKAEKLLSYLGALDANGALTDLGRMMSAFPLSPRFSKILIVGQQHGCLPYVIAVVAALSVGEIFIPEHQIGLNTVGEDSDSDDGAPTVAEKVGEDRRAAKRKAYYAAQQIFSALDPSSDALRLLAVVCAYEYENDQHGFCSKNFLRWKAMEETRKLRQQITNIVRANCPGVIGPFEAKLPPPSKVQVKAVKQILATGFLDQLALRADLCQPPLDINLPSKTKTPIFKTPYVPLFPVSESSVPEDSLIYPHPTSILQLPAPEILAYSELIRSATGRIRMKPVTTLSSAQVVNLAKSTGLLSYSKPLEGFAPIISEGGKVRECWVNVTIGAGQGRKGWQLGARKVKQRREASGWVVL